MPQKSKLPDTAMATPNEDTERDSAGPYDSEALLKSYDKVVDRDAEDLSEAAGIVLDFGPGSVARAIRNSGGC